MAILIWQLFKFWFGQMKPTIYKIQDRLKVYIFFHTVIDLQVTHKQKMPRVSLDLNVALYFNVESGIGMKSPSSDQVCFIPFSLMPLKRGINLSPANQVILYVHTCQFKCQRSLTTLPFHSKYHAVNPIKYFSLNQPQSTQNRNNPKIGKLKI